MKRFFISPQGIRIGIAACILLACSGTVLSAAVWSGIRFSQVRFPSGSGRSVLTRTRLGLANGPRLESWIQPAQYSYSIWYPFERVDEYGDRMSCRVELSGWLRTASRRRNLGVLRCTCEKPFIHHNREYACPNWP